LVVGAEESYQDLCCITTAARCTGTAGYGAVNGVWIIEVSNGLGVERAGGKAALKIVPVYKI
jgi:hypothetical protein